MAKQGRLGEAKMLFQRAIEHDRENTEAINYLATLYMQSRQVNDAVATFRHGIEQVPEFDNFYMKLARVACDYARSREVLRSLLERKPATRPPVGHLFQPPGR